MFWINSIARLDAMANSLMRRSKIMRRDTVPQTDLFWTSVPRLIDAATSGSGGTATGFVVRALTPAASAGRRQ